MTLLWLEELWRNRNLLLTLFRNRIIFMSVWNPSCLSYFNSIALCSVLKGNCICFAAVKKDICLIIYKIRGDKVTPRWLLIWLSSPKWKTILHQNELNLLFMSVRQYRLLCIDRQQRWTGYCIMGIPQWTLIMDACFLSVILYNFVY